MDKNKEDQQKYFYDLFIKQTTKRIEELRLDVRYAGISTIIYILIQTTSNIIHGYYTTFPFAIVPGMVIHFKTIMHTMALSLPGVILLKYRYLIRNYIRTNRFSELYQHSESLGKYRKHQKEE